MADRDNDPLSNWRSTYTGEPEIEVAWNPARRRWEPIYPEDEGYDDERKVPMFWCQSASCYVTIPTD